MSVLSVKEYKVFNLQKEYTNLVSYIYNLQAHINRLSLENVINIADKISYMTDLHDIIKKMNNQYNATIIEIDPRHEDSEEETQHIKAILTDDSFLKDMKYLKYLTKLSNMQISPRGKISLLNMMLTDSFIDVKECLVNLCKKTGFASVHDALSLIIGEVYDKLYDSETYNTMMMYNKFFIPISYKLLLKNKDNSIIYFKKADPSSDSRNDTYNTILENYAELHIKNITDPTQKIILSGYFEVDTLNVLMRTSLICNNAVFTKKKNIENILKNRLDINPKFKKSYLKSTQLYDFLVLSEQDYLDKLDRDYTRYRNLVQNSFMILMKEFIKDDIRNMFVIIKLLLLGNDDNISMAGLLYGLTKDKKVGGDTIANTIYKSLNYTSQIKLRNSNTTMKKELEKIKALTIDDVDMKKQVVATKNMPGYVKQLALEKIEEMKTSNNEYYKQLLYVKTLLRFPWPSSDDDRFFEDIKKSPSASIGFLDGVAEKLNARVFGHDVCKSTIIQLIGKWISNPASSGSAIGLVGPPGVGKTLIAKGIGTALNIPFAQITLGGQNDGEILHGHGYTYSGAQPGMIVKKMVEAGSARCVLYFDELDKATKKHDTNEIFSILIHMTDPNTNGEFQDRFFQEVKFPLNKVVMVFSYNDSSLIDPILLDRITEIEVKPYTTHDKIKITQDYMMKEICDMIGIEFQSIIFDDKNIEYIVENYTLEAGVRELKRKIESLYLQLNIDKIYQRGIFTNRANFDTKDPIYVTKDIIKKYLNKSIISVQEVHKEDMVGVINGLYATSMGKGGIIPIQIFNNYAGSDEKFTLKLTGSQGKVMKESVICAFTAAVHQLKESIRQKIVEEHAYGFHIHAPSGATPKDGPSAGCAFATAFISRILNKKIKHDIAMTGEIELTGKVTKIGGLIYKLNGAKKAGAKKILVSEENKEDIEKIKEENPKLIDDNFEVIMIANLYDVLSYALVDFDKNDFE